MEGGTQATRGPRSPGRATAFRGLLSQLHPAEVLLGVAVIATGTLLLGWLSDLTFWRDEWAFLLHRRGFGADVILDPHYEHIAIAPVLLYKGLQATLGMDSPRPFQVASTITFLASVVLVFAYVRRRVGPWLALAGVLPILVLGPAWDDLLWPFQIGFFGSMAFGLGSLLLLENGDRRSDVAACVLLVVAMTFSSLGLAFAVAAAIAVAVGPDWRRRAYVVAVPVALFALWWIGWGRTAETHVTLDSIVRSPVFVVDGFASSIAALLGFATREEIDVVTLEWGRPLLLGALVLAALALLRMKTPPRTLLVPVALGVSYWFLVAVNVGLFRTPETGRYQYMGAVFVLLIAAGLAGGAMAAHAWRDPARGGNAGASAARARPGWWLVGGTLAVALMASAANLELLHEKWNGLRSFGQLQPAGLAALELSRDHVDPGFELTEENSGVDYLGELDAGSYLSAVDSFGSPAFTSSELAAAPEPARAAADTVFASALGLRLAEPPSELGRCIRAPMGADGSAIATLPPGGAVIRGAPAGETDVGLRRYATEAFPIAAGAVGAGEAALLSIPPDRAPRPWEVELRARGPVAVCGPA